MKRFFVVLLSFVLFFAFSFCSFAAQNNTSVLSSLPEPVADDYNKYFVISDLDEYYLFSFSSDYRLSSGFYSDSIGSLDFNYPLDYLSVNILSQSGQSYWAFTFVNSTQDDHYITFRCYNALTGYLYYSENILVSALSSRDYLVRDQSSYFRLSSFVRVQSFGISLYTNPDIPMSQAQISWNDHYDYSSYFGTFSSYLQSGTSTLSSILTSLNNTYSKVNNIYLEVKTSNSWLEKIYNKLVGETTTQYSEENYQIINEYEEVEAQLMRDNSADVSRVFGQANVALDGSASVFEFIGDTFEDLILSNSAVNALIVLSLSLGLATLILGRKLNHA